jgi:tRNA A-37 threonylcarbamoyl transferase component Bud32
MALFLEVLDISRDGTTGHVVAKARIVDDADPVSGAGTMEMVGGDALEISTRYSGDVEAWLRAQAHAMVARHHQRTATHGDLAKWKGKRIPL